MRSASVILNFEFLNNEHFLLRINLKIWILQFIIGIMVDKGMLSNYNLIANTQSEFLLHHKFSFSTH